MTKPQPGHVTIDLPWLYESIAGLLREPRSEYDEGWNAAIERVLDDLDGTSNG